MNSTQKTSSDWMFVVAGLLVATLVTAVISPQTEIEASRNNYSVEQATVD